MTAKKKKSVTGKPLDIVSIGDCTLDMFLGMNTSASRLCKLNKKDCYLMLSYADKIEADSQVFATGGNSSNLAIGSARLGLRSSFYTVLGKDDIGEGMIKNFKKEGVATDYVVKQPGETNFHVVLNHEAERTIIIYHHKRKYKLPKLKKSAWIYYSSMGEGFQSIHKDLVAHIKQHNIKLGFNPGTLQLKAGYKVLKNVLKVTEVLILNTEEGMRLLGAKHNGNTNFKELMTSLAELGPKQIVVTDGPGGSYGYDGKQFWKLGIYDVPVLERTGAGDSTSTGIIAAMVHGKPLSEALRWGVFNSASVIQEIGPQKGLLKKSQMQKYLRENPKLVATEL